MHFVRAAEQGGMGGIGAAAGEGPLFAVSDSWIVYLARSARMKSKISYIPRSARAATANSKQQTANKDGAAINNAWALNKQTPSA